MKVLIVEPNEKPTVAEIEGNLESMQQIVGGPIQAIYPFEKPVALICNDEGKLLNLPLNRGLRHQNSKECYDVIAGTFLLCAAPADSDGFESLSDTQIEYYKTRFQYPEEFMKLYGKLFCIPVEEGWND